MSYNGITIEQDGSAGGNYCRIDNDRVGNFTVASAVTMSVSSALLFTGSNLC